MSETRPPISWRKRLLFASLPLIVLLGSLEVGFRLSKHSVPIHSGGASNFLPDPDLGWRLNPDRVETNELGVRDGPYKANAERKVVLLGDSVSLGEAVALEATYAHLVEVALETDGRSHDVINTAVAGYSTFQELRYLELRGMALEPNAVVLQFCFNDVVERYTSLAEYGGANYFVGVDTRKHARGLYGFLIRNSVAFEALGRAMQRKAIAREEYTVRNLAKDALSEPLDAAWVRALDELSGVRRACAAKGVPLLVVVTPYRFQLEDPASLRQPQDRLLAWAKTHEVPVVDLLVPFAAAKEPLFVDGNHFNEAGHRLAAKVLFEPLRLMLRQ